MQGLAGRAAGGAGGRPQLRGAGVKSHCSRCRACSRSGAGEDGSVRWSGESPVAGGWAHRRAAAVAVRGWPRRAHPWIFFYLIYRGRQQTVSENITLTVTFNLRSIRDCRVIIKTLRSCYQKFRT
ncbi:hypothetical protein C2845_PM13G00700 [Panicum miliaceum]|uniref:Uncharacterized protein n=1 Tax=Panicum miliaceum TaxID=4540 RepID=A0A3L6RJI8_PANMI|nr:hypothetical protein C2845_PM13G00700 [Panicum miliaceum]